MAVGDLMLVDFDGTLIRRDSTRWMVELLLRKRPWRMLWVLPELRMLFRGADENTLQAAKVRCVGKLLESLAEKNLGTVQGKYRRRSLNALRSELAEHMATEGAEGTMILVATASPRFLVAAAIGDRADAVLGTEFAQSNGRFLRTLAQPQCHGPHKPHQIQSWLKAQPTPYRITEAWSDSRSDQPMMSMAEKECWV